jgi:hypothetical protein
MTIQQIGHKHDSVSGGNVWQPDNSGVCLTEQIDQRAEVTVYRYENPSFLRRYSQ